MISDMSNYLNVTVRIVSVKLPGSFFSLLLSLARHCLSVLMSEYHVLKEEFLS